MSLRTCLDCPHEITGPPQKVRCATCARQRRLASCRARSSRQRSEEKKPVTAYTGNHSFNAWWTEVQEQRKRGDLAGLMDDGTYNLTPWCEAGAPTPGDQQEGLKTVRLPRSSTRNELPAELRQGRPTVYLSNL